MICNLSLWTHLFFLYVTGSCTSPLMVIFGAPPATIVAHDGSGKVIIATVAATLYVFTSFFIVFIVVIRYDLFL